MLTYINIIIIKILTLTQTLRKSLKVLIYVHTSVCLIMNVYFYIEKRTSCEGVLTLDYDCREGFLRPQKQVILEHSHTFFNKGFLKLWKYKNKGKLRIDSFELTEIYHAHYVYVAGKSSMTIKIFQTLSISKTKNCSVLTLFISHMQL